MIGETVGHYKIISEIGRGGMGVVYLAEHLSLGKKFAVKILSSELTNSAQFRKRFYEEAHNQAQLNHPNIVQATDFFEFKDQFVFVMEYVDGNDLGTIIKENGPLLETTAFTIFKDVLEALNYAHSKNLIHRDVKPQNILIDERGRARLMDFGIAIMFGRERLTATGTAVGSPWYMSPEQITNPLHLDKRSDVYAAGIVLYEMLTGDVPFDGESDFAVREQQVHNRPMDPHQRNAKIDSKLSALILKALEKNPDNRYQSCADFLQSLHDYQSKKTSTGKDGILKKLIVLFMTLAIVSAGVSIYFIFVRKHTVVIHDRQATSIQHEKANLWINNAMDKAANVCLEVKDVDLKRKNLQKALDLNFPDLAEQYKKVINDKNQKIKEATSQYKYYIKKLGELNGSVVEEELKNIATKQNGQVSTHRLQVVNSHYHHSMGNAMPSDTTLTRELCE